jgi:hypothetical protein
MRRAVIFLSIGLTLVAAACLPKPSSWYGDSGPYVGVIGDSLVHAAETGGGLDPDDTDRFVSQRLAQSGYRASVSAMIGAVTADLRTVAAFPEPGFELLVLALGTNDMHDGAVPVDVAIGDIVTYLDAHTPACTALVTIVDEPSWGLDVTAPVYNAALADLATERADVIIADWAAVVDAHPEYLGSDGVHHTAAGQEAYRSLIDDAAGQCASLAPA